MSPRFQDRPYDSMRPLTFEVDVSKHAEGSCLVKFGDTHVLCTATVEEKVPSFMKNTHRGWVTAEYGMLPRATGQRTDREAARGKQQGRTQEIQRLIGRSLRAIVDMEKMGERQIKIDCDVLQADGGTRTAAISGGYVALYLALRKLKNNGTIKEIPLKTPVTAVSCGIIGGIPMLDLDYSEDSTAGTDANFVMTGSGSLIEVQATAEGAFFSDEEFMNLLALARLGSAQIQNAQNKALGLD